MSTIAVSGSAGHLGSNLCHWLLDNTEHEVVGIDNFSSGYKENLPVNDRFSNYYCDITNAADLDRIFSRHTPAVCYAMAAYAAEGRSNYIRKFIHYNNTVGTATTINCCVNHNCKIIFSSSVAIYSGTPPFTEETVPNPVDEYALSKLTSERSIEIAGEQQGLDWCIIRLRNIFGERQSLWDTARNLFGIWCYKALNNQPLTIFGDGSNKRSFTAISDILSPLYNAIDCNKQIINLGSEFPYTIKQAAEIFGEVTGHKNIIHTEPRHEVQNAYCSVEKSKQLLGFEDNTTLYSGLKKMWEWARVQPKKELQKSPRLEITKNLHSSII